ncbi:uncharacterized protein LACBIDRAFT_306451 [Laccaria bicolor S238N-H82]|uniref:Predicted protein n=1 Tax=Laccaria bicolor (strain S238N-H82 / ATCC MYA-4686) TaxID=486041 RepID=B0DMY4_LACBS|nr:uncharacterized protein LACBIDRAFT_306451 [Laccaria bicolor S238N-H82]EDR04055.1 predicted protein [Laccaria bicolor S238N-H82]|eukprot:XP_001885310.1 predicted protein [Laccaria bicolor S238N-H82]
MVSERVYFWTSDGAQGALGNFVSPSSHFTVPEILRLVRQSIPKKQVLLPTNQPHGNAWKVWGSLWVIGNLHITTLGHDYASYEHNQMTVSHVITEFSFGPFSPETTLPLDNSFEITHECIFSQFDLDPLATTQHQGTTTFLPLLLCCVGVIGGVFVLMGYAIRITTRGVGVLSSADQTPGIVAAQRPELKSQIEMGRGRTLGFDP